MSQLEADGDTAMIHNDRGGNDEVDEEARAMDEEEDEEEEDEEEEDEEEGSDNEDESETGDQDRGGTDAQADDSEGADFETIFGMQPVDMTPEQQNTERQRLQQIENDRADLVLGAWNATPQLTTPSHWAQLNAYSYHAGLVAAQSRVTFRTAWEDLLRSVRMLESQRVLARAYARFNEIEALRAQGYLSSSSDDMQAISDGSEQSVSDQEDEEMGDAE